MASKRGKIDELYDFSAMEEQHKKVMGLIEKFVETANNVKPIAVKLEGSEKTKEVIDGIKQVGNATQQMVTITNTAINEYGKLITVSQKVIPNYEQTRQILEKYTGTLEQNTKLQASYKIKIDEIGRAIKEQKKAYDQGLVSQEQYEEKLGDLTRRQAELKVANTELTQTIKSQVKEQQAAAGSYDEMNQVLGRLRDQMRQFSDEEKNSDIGKHFANVIDELDAKLKAEDASMGNHFRKVGDYQGQLQGSFKILADAIERTRERSERLNQTMGATSPEAVSVRRELESLERIMEKPAITKLAANYGDATRELRTFQKELVNLERNGMGDSDFAQEIRKHLAELTDQIGDTRDEIRAMSSDTRGFDQLSSSISFLTSTYQTYVGVAELAGENNEDVQESIRRLVAVQAVANGMQEISTQLTTKGTAVNKAYAFVQGLVATALDKTATSAVRAKAALGLLGIAATVIGAIVIAYQMLNKSASDYASRQKQVNDVLKEAGSEYSKAVSQVNELRINIDLAKKGLISKKEVVDQYNETLGKTTGEVKTLDEAERSLIKNGDAYIQMTLMKAAANIALQKAAEKATEMALEANKPDTVDDLININERKAAAQALAEKDAEVVRLYNEGKQALLDGNTELSRKLFADRQKIIDQIVSENLNPKLKKERDEFVKIATDFQKKAAEISKNFNFSFTGKTDTTKSGKDKKDRTSQLERDLQAEFEIYRLAQQRKIDLLDSIAADEEVGMKMQLVALSQSMMEKRRLVEAEAEFEKKIRKNSAVELERIEAQKQDKLLRIADEGIVKTGQIQEAYKKSLLKNNKEILASYSSTYNQLKKILDDWQKKQDEKKKKDDEGREETKKALEDLAGEINELAFTLLSGDVDREKNRIQEQIDILEEKKQKDIEVANQSILNEQDKAAKIAVIEARANAEKERLERRKRQLDAEKARYERMQNIASIIQTTGLAIMKALAEYPGPVGTGLAIAYGAIGAAQIAKIIATPLPKYKEGITTEEGHPGGPAVVGDGGVPEYVVTPDGSVTKTPAVPTLMDLPKKTKVFKDEFAFMDAMMAGTIQHAVTINETKVSDAAHWQLLSRDIQSMEKGVVKAIKNMPQPVFRAPHPVKTMVHGQGLSTKL